MKHAQSWFVEEKNWQWREKEQKINLFQEWELAENKHTNSQRVSDAGATRLGFGLGDLVDHVLVYDVP